MRRVNLILVAAGLTACRLAGYSAIITVTTTNNVSPGAGAVSLKQALGQLHDGDTVRFNIPGTGPFYLATPAGGYPLITNNNVTIDGYSQPGSAPNSNSILAPNNAKLRIVLDSRNGNFASMNYEPDNSHAGYGEGEYAVLGIFRGTNAVIRGLCILGKVPAAGDNFNYLISFARDYQGTASGGHVSGCWLGVGPDGVSVSGAMNGITAYHHEDASGQNLAGIDNLIVGVEPRATNAPAEFNVIVQMAAPIIIEGNSARVSGNFLGVLPEGLRDYNVALDPAYHGDFGSQGAIEIGWGGNNTLIGTDGDGVNDANERNIISGTLPKSMGGYDHTIEFYENDPGTNIVIAGNYFGVGIDGQTRFTNGVPAINAAGAPAQYRIGSDFDGVSDGLEANLIFNNWPPTLFSPAALAVTPGPAGLNFFDELSAGSTVSTRGNRLVNNFPYPQGLDKGNGAVTNFYRGVLADATQGIAPTLATNSTARRIVGTYPLANPSLYPYTVIDLYVADAAGLRTGINSGLAQYPAGFVQGAVYLGSFDVGATNNSGQTPGQFSFDISQLGLAGGYALTVTANYSASAPGTHNAIVMTSLFSNPIDIPLAGGGPLKITSVKAQGRMVMLDWAGGLGPYTVQKKGSLSESQWQSLLTTTNQHAVVPLLGNLGYLRITTGVATSAMLFTVWMAGDRENPAVNTLATGFGSLTLTGNTLSYDIIYSGLTGSATAAHIHGAATSTQNSGVVFPMTISGIGTSGRLIGADTVTDAQRTNLLAGQCYANIHTAGSPGGEIRGQVTPANLRAALAGAAEVQPVNTGGSGLATLWLIGNQLSWKVEYWGLSTNATAADLHGPAGTNAVADILIPLGTPTGATGSLTGWATASDVQLGYLVDGLAYINLHTASHSSGEIWGRVGP